jgi:hypothetical protein
MCRVFKGCLYRYAKLACQAQQGISSVKWWIAKTITSERTTNRGDGGWGWWCNNYSLNDPFSNSYTCDFAQPNREGSHNNRNLDWVG